MCGIVGYVGPEQAAGVLLAGLKRLEYRGYDSAGLAVQAGGQVQVLRAVGKLNNLSRALGEQPLSGTTGLGHTRWATHGRPSQANAHPHSAGDITLVHNGIIENHVELKHELAAAGVEFSSDTDTEIAAQLVNRAHEGGQVPLLEAVRRVLPLLQGAYALAVLSRLRDGVLVVAKHGSPLVLGVGEGQTLCGSDIPALLDYTRDILVLEDGELAELRAGSVLLETHSGEPIERAPKRINWSPVQAEKGGYKHFMLKEIFEQPRALEDTLRGRIQLEAGDLVAGELGLSAEVARSIDRVCLLACGTSFHAGLVGRYWLEALARVPAQCELASEVRYREPVFSARDLVIAVSQSGETADTLAAVRAAKAAGAQVLAVANVLDSALPRAADGALYTHAGPEIGVASTKCFTTQLAALLMLTVYLGRRRESLSVAQAQALLQALVEVPEAMRQALGYKERVLSVARKYQHSQHMLFLGRGLGYPIALEGALKLKEISYAHAEGYAAGEMKHGPIALIDEQMPVVVILNDQQQFEKTASNVAEVRARGGQVIAVVAEGDERPRQLADQLLPVPRLPSAVVAPLISVIPLQLLAYFIADLKGTDVDQPRNLAKTVTVE